MVFGLNLKGDNLADKVKDERWARQRQIFFGFFSYYGQTLTCQCKFIRNSRPISHGFALISGNLWRRLDKDNKSIPLAVCCEFIRHLQRIDRNDVPKNFLMAVANIRIWIELSAFILDVALWFGHKFMTSFIAHLAEMKCSSSNTYQNYFNGYNFCLKIN